MGQLRAFLTPTHLSARRNYASRAGEDKPRHAELAKQFGRDYWDGPRSVGYGGYVDDGRWAKIASRILEAYAVPADASVLDIGCGKGFLLNEILRLRPQGRVRGIDVSQYALDAAPESIRPCLSLGSAENLDVPSKAFDLVLSINTLHNLELPELMRALAHVERVSRERSYICVESYRNESEKWNLLRWQLTCECFYTPREWEWIFAQAGYTGDYEFIFFE